MNNFKMTRLVLAILALVGFTGAQAAAGISPAALQGSSVFQNPSSSTGAGVQPVMSSQMDAQDAWPETPTVSESDPTQPWKDWIDQNPGVDVSQQDGFGGFSGDQQQELINYQNNASQGGSQTGGAQTGVVVATPEDEGSEQDWDDDDGELQGQTSTEPDLTPAELQQWKDWITENNITVAQLEGETNFKNLNASDRMALKLYAGMQTGSSVSGYPTTASTTTTTTGSASVNPAEQALVQQWIDYYIKGQGYTAAQVQGVTGFNDFSAAAQQQLITAASGGSSKFNAATGYAQQGASWAANTQVGKETGQIANQVYVGMKQDIETGADQAARGLFNWGLKKLGVNVQLPAQATPQTAGVQPTPGAQTRPVQYGPQPAQQGPGSLYQPNRPVEYGPQPQQVGPGTLYQGQTNRTGMTPPPPPPGGKKVPVQPGMTTPQVVSNSAFGGSTSAVQTTADSVPSSSDGGLLVPISKVTSVPGLPMPTRVGAEFGALDLKDRVGLNQYANIAIKLKNSPSTNPTGESGWSDIPATGVYSQQTLLNYYNTHK